MIKTPAAALNKDISVAEVQRQGSWPSWPAELLCNAEKAPRPGQIPPLQVLAELLAQLLSCICKQADVPHRLACSRQSERGMAVTQKRPATDPVAEPVMRILPLLTDFLLTKDRLLHAGSQAGLCPALSMPHQIVS